MLPPLFESFKRATVNRTLIDRGPFPVTTNPESARR